MAKASVTLLQNMKFELYLGSNQYTFLGAKSTHQIPVEEINTPEFQHVKKYFVIRKLPEKIGD